MNNLWLDIRFALRQLRKSPGFTLTAVLTLAFGIGATTAIFSIVEGVLLRPLPFPHPDRLVVLSDILNNANIGADSGEAGVTSTEIPVYERETRSFAALGGYQQTGYELVGAGAPAQINAARVTASIFPVLEVSPLMGRVFTEGEDSGHAQVVVISYAMWRSRFGGDANVLGRKIELDRKTYQVIGVMPRGFEFPLVPGQLNQSELWTPMSFTPDEMSGAAAASWNFGMVGRLKPGVTAAQAKQDAESIALQIDKSFPAFMSSLHIDAVVRSLADETVAEARPLVRALFLAVTVVLFIACANLAGLLLVRVIRRRRETAVRLALGSSGAVVVRQSLIETLALSIAGGLTGLGLAAVALRAGVSLLPETLPRIQSIRLDWHVVLFALGAAVLTGFLCGLIPALAAARTSVNETLKEGGRTGSAGGAHARLRSALVVTEIAVALVLLVASGLLLRSFEKLREVNLGFHTDHMLTASYSLPQKQYSTQASIDAFNNNLLERLQQLPGVEAAGVTSILPAAGNGNNNAFVADGYTPPPGAQLDLSWSSQVMGDYFKAAGIPLLRGRAFTLADSAKAPLVCVVNHSLAAHFWPGQDPIGKRVRWGMVETPTPWVTVVGEIGDIKQNSPDQPTRYQIYQPFSQNTASFGSLAPADSLNAQGGSIVLRTAMPPDQMIAALRDTVRSIDPQLPLTQVESMTQAISTTEAPRRFNAALISSFAAAALLLALLGIYSVIAFSAAMRTQEVAIRLALGSQRSAVMKLILGSGARLGLIGCAIGAVGAIFATRLLRSLLFEVSPLDPAVIVLAAFAIFALAIAASFIPARRAAAIEPMQALRSE
ncbi:MAG TPA: ABC transporter permease [Terracidiphilus sp.]|nr:ABC transporter permease [Terracidiphilus sp.]